MEPPTFVADLHVHSRFSRATSKDCDLQHLDLWGERKGLGVLGTGDFTHPGWRAELAEKLAPAEEGLYVLAEEHRRALAHEFRPGGQSPSPAVRFILTVEISSIYKRHGRVRKVHNLVFMPDLAAAGRFSQRLAAAGNVASDGRPILGLDSRDLLEMVLETAPGAFLVPAHIWTPHFSVLGARSGFDAFEECYGDLTGHIFAAETGLSSDPPMNWRLSALDGITLISNSDAHSPAKLGREANIFAAELSFPAIRRALEKPREGGFLGTIEFFPEEGKYHLDGHRACGRCMEPAETRAADGKCPDCGRPVTLGVLHRVEDLADRPAPRQPERAPGCVHLVPLPEVLGEILGTGPSSKTVLAAYAALLGRLGPELAILNDLPLAALDGPGPPLLREAIARMRSARVLVTPGYDGEYGRISLFGKEERSALAAAAQGRLF